MTLRFALCILGFAATGSAFRTKTSLNYLRLKVRDIGLTQAANFLDDVLGILHRPEMTDHIKKAAAGDSVEGQLVGMQFIPLGHKYGTDAATFVSFDGSGLSWNQFCNLAETEASLKQKIDLVAQEWKNIVGTFGEAPHMEKKKAMSLVDSSNKVFKGQDAQKCIDAMKNQEADASDCFTRLSKPVLAKHGLKAFHVPMIMPQMLMFGKDDTVARGKLLDFVRDWATATEKVTGITDVAKKQKLSTGMQKAYAISFIDDILKTMDLPEMKVAMEALRKGDPCAGNVAENLFKPVCSKHGFAPGAGYMPPVWNLMNLGPEVKERIWQVAEKWATMLPSGP
jgi:hypothetical protein